MFKRKNRVSNNKFSNVDKVETNRMSDQERDKEIFQVIARAYAFEWDQKERLDNKLNNFIAIAATVATLNMGVGFFVLERVSPKNTYYFPLVVTLLIGVGLFVFAIVISLRSYKPMKYYITPKDSRKLIEKYKDLTKTHVIREVAATMAEVINLNREVNVRKADTLRCVFWLLILGVTAILIFTFFLVLALGVPPVN